MREEDALQREVAAHLDEHYPDLLWSHFPAGESRSERTGAKLKSFGLKRGWADLIIIRPGGKVAFIELKAPKGRLSPHQIAFAGDCDEQGVPHLVCRSLAEVQGALAAWGIPTKARAA